MAPSFFLKMVAGSADFMRNFNNPISHKNNQLFLAEFCTNFAMKPIKTAKHFS